jgi:hypothetical protein
MTAKTGKGNGKDGQYVDTVYCPAYEVSDISRSPEPQILRLRLAQKTSQTPLRMTIFG